MRTSSLAKTSAFTLVLSLTLLSGCKVGPNYHPPVTPVTATDSWISASSDAKAQREQDWWRHFHDPVLDRLIAKALAGNWDLKIAEARVAQARAARASAFNDLLPTVNTDANFERQGNRLAFPATPGFDLSKPFDIYQAGFDASWELDLFGGRRRELESAGASLQAGEATRDDARISLLAEVARTYVDIRQYQSQLALVQETIAADEDSARIARERFKVGDTAEFDVTEAQAQVKQARAQLPYYQNLLLQTQYAMDVLLGEKPGATASIITSPAAIPSGDAELVLAAPARVIASRPDVRSAERTLAASTAEQGVAVAQFFPDISVVGFLGVLNTDANSLVHGGSKSWDVGGNLVWPILNYGRLSANLHAAQAREQEALAQYQKSVLTALSDVERSVTSYTKEQEHSAALEAEGLEDTHAVKIARERYKEGFSSFIEVLDAERALYAAQSQVAASKALTAQDLIAVYKSLGGGWKAAEPKVSDADFIGPRQPAK